MVSVSDEIRNLPYIQERDGIITKANTPFYKFTNFNPEEILGNPVGMVWNEYLRINVNISIIEKKAKAFLFTKFLEVREVTISVFQYPDIHDRIYTFSEIPNSHLDSKIMFVRETFSDNIVGSAIFSVPDLILLKANQKYLDFMDEPYNKMENSIGKSISEIVSGFEGTQAEVIWNNVLQNQKTSYIKENRHDKFARGVTYWDSTQTPVFENGKMKYIFETATEVTERVVNRKKLEEQNETIRLQKKQLESIINTLSDYVSLIDRHGNFVKKSMFMTENGPGIDNIFDKSSQDIVYYDFDGNLIPHDELPFYQIFEGKRIKAAKLKAVLDSRREVYVIASGTPVMDDSGEIIMYIVVSQDITELMNLTKDINHKNKQLEAIIENMSDSIAIYDSEGNVSLTNVKAQGIYVNVKPGAFMKNAHDGLQFYDMDNNEIPVENLPTRRAFRGEKIRNERIKIKDSDKLTIVEINAVPISNTENKTESVLIRHRDITETIEYEEKLKQQSEFLQNILDNTHENLFVIDGNGKFLINKNNIIKGLPAKFENIDELYRTEKFYDLSGNEIPLEEIPMYRVMRGKTIKDEILHLKAEDKEYYFNVIGTPIFDENGDFKYGIISNHDITELVLSQKSLHDEYIQLELLKKEADTANKAKSQFLANMSHEIRSPLNGIMGIMELLLGSELTDEQMEMANMVDDSAQSLLRIIDSILDLSKIEAGKVELSPEYMDIYSFVDKYERVYTHLAKKKNLIFRTKVEDSVPRSIYADSTCLNQIITNLISNAIKFTYEGQIELHVKNYKAIGNKVQLMFSVTDTGIGIKKQDIPRLFNYFTQLDDSKTKRFQGTGLGLVISKRLVELMEGEIFVESEFGKGSIFCFTIWVDKEPENDESINVNNIIAFIHQQKTVNILLVEDDYTNQFVFKKICEKMEWNLDIASNGKMALEILERKRFDVILMDIQMPEMSGFEVTRIIRERERMASKHVPIIATTAYAMKKDRIEVMEAGMNDYISKPIKSAKLIEVIEKWINR